MTLSLGTRAGGGGRFGDSVAAYGGSDISSISSAPASAKTSPPSQRTPPRFIAICSAAPPWATCGACRNAKRLRPTHHWRKASSLPSLVISPVAQSTGTIQRGSDSVRSEHRTDQPLMTASKRLFTPSMLQQPAAPLRPAPKRAIVAGVPDARPMPQSAMVSSVRGRGCHLCRVLVRSADHAVQAPGKEQTRSRVLLAIDDVQHLACGTREGEAVAVRRNDIRDAIQDHALIIGGVGQTCAHG